MGLAAAGLVFLLGLILVVRGGDWFVDTAVWMAEASGLPKFLIGATVVSLATTLPEILVSAMAAVDGAADMAAGNAIGSVTANTGLILALSLIVHPAPMARHRLAPKGCLLMLSLAALLLLTRDGSLALWEVLPMGGLMGAFLLENISGTAEKRPAEQAPASGREIRSRILCFLFGVTVLMLGSRMLVDSGTVLATALGVSPRVIAVTLMAVGTSLPELVTAVTALVKHQSALSVGNILGANLIDVTVILPLCAMLSGSALPISAGSLLLDLPFCLAEAVLAVIPALCFRRFSRLQGLLLLAVYAVYLALTLLI